MTCFRKGISDSRGGYLLECVCLSLLPVFVRLTLSFCNNIEFRTNDSESNCLFIFQIFGISVEAYLGIE